MIAATVPGARAQTAAPPDARPTVAVMYFSNASLVDHATYEPLVLGIADQLITSLQANPGIRVVERREIQKLLDEGTLSKSDRIDPETAVQIGKILGAHHMIFGGFLIEPGGRMRIAARAVNVNTSEVEHTQSVTERMTNIIDALDDLAGRLNGGMHLPDMPVKRRKASQPAPRSTRWFFLYSQALVEEDSKRKDAAVALYRQALAENPDYEPARLALERLGSGS
jgi:TolB-like protein